MEKTYATKNRVLNFNMEHWKLRNKSNTLSISDYLHSSLVSPSSENSIDSLIDPDFIGSSPLRLEKLINSFLGYLQFDQGIRVEDTFSKKLHSICGLKCQEKPSVLKEFGIATQLFEEALLDLKDADCWNFLLFAEHPSIDNPDDNSNIRRCRVYVYRELVKYAITIGGGFTSFGTMDNYRGFQGGLYSDSISYRQFTPK